MYMYVYLSCCYSLLHYSIFSFSLKIYFRPAPTWEKNWALNSNQTTLPLMLLIYVSLNILKLKPPHLRVSSYTLLDLSNLFRNEVNWTLNIQLNWTLSFRNSKAESTQAQFGIGVKMRTLKELNRFRSFTIRIRIRHRIHDKCLNAIFVWTFCLLLFIHSVHFLWAIIGMNYVPVFVGLLSVLVSVM